MITTTVATMKLESRVLDILQKVGIRKGQTVLDFGCGYGMYTIPVAKIAGKQGRVYALDKNKETLDVLMQKTKSAGLKNVERMETSGELEIKLADETVDVVLLFDVFHSYYFPQAGDRRRLLSEIHRIMKPSAFLSVWPKHMESETEDEVEKANFYLEKELSETLVLHDKNLEKGKILNFRKGSGNRDER